MKTLAKFLIVPVLLFASTASATTLSCQYDIYKFSSCSLNDEDCFDGLKRVDIESDSFLKNLDDENLFDFTFSGKYSEAKNIVFSGWATNQKLLDLKIENTISKSTSSAGIDHEKIVSSLGLILSTKKVNELDIHLTCTIL